MFRHFFNAHLALKRGAALFHVPPVDRGWHQTPPTHPDNKWPLEHNSSAAQ